MAEEGKEEVDDFGCSSNCKLQLAIFGLDVVIDIGCWLFV